MLQLMRKMKLKWSFFVLKRKTAYDVQTEEMKIEALRKIIHRGTALVYLVQKPNEV
jgi:hypothetical protein